MDINHIAKLAKLKISEQEAAKLEKELESILGYVEKLNEVDTKDVVPTGHARGGSNVVSEDIHTDWPGIRKNGDEAFRDRLFSNTKNVKDGLIVTPKILE